MQAAEDVAASVGTAPACRALGVPRASLYRRRKPRSEVRRARPKPKRALEVHERQTVLDILHSDRFVDQAPAEVYATLLDQKTYLCSPRTMYRILAEQDEVRERRNQLQHPNYQRHELLATATNQVWSWDITKLLGPAKWTYFYLYVILDIFSRYTVGWLIAFQESASLAEQLIAESCQKQSILPGQLTVHADRGPSMTSKPLALFLADMGIAKTHSRPYCSNDNPFSEAQFKTLKYRPEFPERFGSIQDARSFCQTFFHWYNNEHHHGGLALLTPAVIHHGLADQVLEQRQLVLSRFYATHPERFVNGSPKPRRPPEAVWINPPIKTTNQDAPGSTQTGSDDLRVDPACITYEQLVAPTVPPPAVMDAIIEGTSH